MNLSPLSQRRIENFRSNKRGFYSAIIFVFLFVITIFAEFIANDKPILVVFDNKFYFPVIEKIPETFFGGEFETESDYKDPFVQKLINNNGFFVMPLIEYSYDTINYKNHGFSFKFIGNSRADAFPQRNQRNQLAGGG